MSPTTRALGCSSSNSCDSIGPCTSPLTITWAACTRPITLAFSLITTRLAPPSPAITSPRTSPSMRRPSPKRISPCSTEPSPIKVRIGGCAFLVLNIVLSNDRCGAARGQRSELYRLRRPHVAGLVDHLDLQRLDHRLLRVLHQTFDPSVLLELQRLGAIDRQA